MPGLRGRGFAGLSTGDSRNDHPYFSLLFLRWGWWAEELCLGLEFLEDGCEQLVVGHGRRLARRSYCVTIVWFDTF